MKREGLSVDLELPSLRAPTIHALERDVWHLVEDSSRQRLRMPVLVRLGERDGKLVCTGLILGASPSHPHERARDEITARDLRAVPLGAIVANIASLLVDRESPRFEDLESEDAVLIRDLVQTAAWPVNQRPRARPGPKGWDDAHWTEVAQCYRGAVQKRQPVRAAIQERFNVSESTARRWIERARDRGLLGDAIPGKAGEREKDPAKEDSR